MRMSQLIQKSTLCFVLSLILLGSFELGYGQPDDNKKDPNWLKALQKTVELDKYFSDKTCYMIYQRETSEKPLVEVLNYSSLTSHIRNGRRWAIESALSNNLPIFSFDHELQSGLLASTDIRVVVSGKIDNGAIRLEEARAMGWYVGWNTEPCQSGASLEATALQVNEFSSENLELVRFQFDQNAVCPMDSKESWKFTYSIHCAKSLFAE